MNIYYIFISFISFLRSIIIHTTSYNQNMTLNGSSHVVNVLPRRLTFSSLSCHTFRCV